MTRYAVVLACLAAVACGSPPGTGSPDLSREPSSIRAALGAPFTLRMGESADVDGQLRLTALTVTEDSRCPIDVACVWAGDAAVAILLESSAAAGRTDTLHTLPDRKSRTSYASLMIMFTTLDPPPSAGEKTAGYRATFRVDTAGAPSP